MKIVIHTYPARLWYVKEYLIPSLQEQGINNIIIKNDKYHIGNLMSFILSLNKIGDAWHLQDDVIICRDFYKRTKDIKTLACGFCAAGFERHEIVTGKTTVKNMWFSFPCMYIPGDIAQEFHDWFKAGNYSKDFSQMIESGKMDDLIFLEYLNQYHPNMEVINIKPALVDHIDYIIGGSIANKQRSKIARATYFEDLDLVKALEQRIANRREENYK